MKGKSLSRVQLFATPWTAAHQAPSSMGFSRQEYWNGVPLPSPDKQLISKIYNQLMQLKCGKINDRIKQWAKEIDISPKKTYDG